MNPAKQISEIYIEDIYELSPMQQGMLFHSIYDLESAVYIVQYHTALEGELKLDLLKQAWQKVIAHHSILRTSFHWQDLEKPVQVVYDRAYPTWHELDWRELAEPEQREKLRQFLDADRNQGFELTQAPLMRMTLIETGDRRFDFIWTIHHLLVDGWSIRLILEDVFTCYNALCDGVEPRLGPSRPFGDYIQWMQSQKLQDAEQYWRQALKGFSTPTRLGIDKRSNAPRDTRQSYNEESLLLTEDLTERLRQFSRTQQVTMGTLMHGALGLVLSRYSGQRDIVYGAVVSGRPAALDGVEAMVGPFINTLPLRLKTDPAQRLSPWLKQVQEEQAEARQYEYSPLAQVQHWSDVDTGLPLFETIFAFNNLAGSSAVAKPHQRALQVRSSQAFGKSNYALAIEAEGERQLLINIGYDTQRFDSDSIRRLLRHLGNVLEAFPENASRPLCEIPLLTPSELAQRREDWNAYQSDYPRQARLQDLFVAQAEKHPYEIAVSFEREHLTYQELNQQANRLANYLLTLGVQPETMVGICLERSLDMVIATLAILKVGAAYVPLSPAYPKERLTFMIQDAGVSLVLTSGQLADRLPDGCAIVLCDAAASPRIAQSSPENPAGAGDCQSTAYVMYTSGSTGAPKGISVSHRSIARLVLNTNYIDLNSTDRIAQCSNFSFDAFTFELWGALLCGARLVIITKEVALSPKEFAEQLKENQITVLFLTTALFNQLAIATPQAFSSLHTLLFGGEKVDQHRVREVLRQGPPQRLLHVYGPTENTTFSSWYLVREVPEAAATVPIGIPISNSTMHILDNDLGPVPIFVPGELYVGGDGLAHGYLGRPDLTAERFIPDPFSDRPGARLYKTGDLACYLADGNVEFIGRADGQVKVRGFRIEPGEIESVLLHHPSVKEATVQARQVDESRRLVAYLVVGNDPEFDLSALRAFLLEKLPDYMIPAHFVILDKLPLNQNGKVDRDALPGPEMIKRDSSDDFIAPRDELETGLAQIWAELLNVGPIGVNENFFELGGDSLLAIRLMGAIQKRFGQELPLATLFQTGSIAGLAEVLRLRKEAAPRLALVKIQPKGQRPPLFCVHPGSGNVLCYVPLARRLGVEQPFYGLQDPNIQEDPRQQKAGDFDVALEEMAAHYVAMMHSVQAAGPYLLAGWSFGSHVAFEMAQQLRASGHDVAFLGLFDSAVPAVIQQMAEYMDDSDLLATIARELGVAITAGDIRPLAWNDQLELVAGMIAKTDAMGGKAEAAWIDREVEIFKARIRVIRRYSPRPYAGPITLYRASEMDEEDLKIIESKADQRLKDYVQDSTLGWRELSTEPVTVNFVPGNHATMTREPNVETLAQKIAAGLQAGIARRREGAEAPLASG